MENPSVLKEAGISLLNGELIQRTFEQPQKYKSMATVTETRFVLTNYRLFFLEKQGKQTEARMALLEDVLHLYLLHRTRNIWFLIGAIVAGIIGISLFNESNAIVQSVLGWLFLAISIIAGICYYLSGKTALVTHIGSQECQINVLHSILPEAEGFVAAFFSTKLGLRMNDGETPHF